MPSPKVVTPILVKINNQVRMEMKADGVIPRVVMNSRQVRSAHQTLASRDVILPSEAARICWIKRKERKKEEEAGLMCTSLQLNGSSCDALT